MVILNCPVCKKDFPRPAATHRRNIRLGRANLCSPEYRAEHASVMDQRRKLEAEQATKK